MSKPKVLVVGAGAVGQVYARHFQLGGAEVTFLVKAKYAEEARKGFTMYPLNQGVKPVRFEGFMKSYIDKGGAAGLPVATLTELSARLTALRAA